MSNKDFFVKLLLAEIITFICGFIIFIMIESAFTEPSRSVAIMPSVMKALIVCTMMPILVLFNVRRK